MDSATSHLTSGCGHAVLQSPRRRSQRNSPALPAQHIKGSETVHPFWVFRVSAPHSSLVLVTPPSLASDRGVEDDPRPEPEYEVLYKQAVSSEDMYLGMSGRDPSTHWCDDMIVRIKLPEQKLADCDLDVTAKFLDLRTPKFRLGLHLQHPCDPDAGNAKFDSSKGELTVTLKMNRELDYLKN